jgi:hypothetical protein
MVNFGRLALIGAFLVLASCGGSSVTDTDSNGPGYDWAPGEVDPQDQGGGGGELTPCGGADDCPSGWCIHTEDWGNVCTTTCADSCPEAGWVCVQVQDFPVTSICIPAEDLLCEACDGDDDCLGPPFSCVEVAADEASFCALPCGPTSLCPAGYDCAAPGPGQATVCLPPTGSCLCAGDQIGGKMPCTRENEHGVCTGEMSCGAEGGWTACSAPEPAAESCDGLDNDCDGDIDEGLEPGPCAVQNMYGLCDGVKTCAGGQGWLCDAPEPQAEVCDGLDNECNGTVDDGFELKGQPCDSDLDADLCALGLWACDAAGTSLVCLDDTPAEEICNGADDDCDGAVDEDFLDLGLPCDGDDADLCALGVWACAGDGAGLTCEGDVNQEEVCDGLDNDCDGVIDDGASDTDGDGILDCFDTDDDDDLVPDETDNCPLVENPDQTDSDEDGIGDACDDDDDGDGIVDDEDCAPLDPTINPLAEEACDGIDNDCDAVIDQMEIPCATLCGSGFVVCVDGVWEPCSATEPLSCMDFDTCEWYQTCEGPCPAAPPELCGGGDEDCDGVVDEEDAQGCQPWYADKDEDDYGDPEDVACLCAAKAPYTAMTGEDCNDEAEQINPMALEICNTLDDDCDGAADDFFEACETPCGVGTRTCSGGIWSPCSETNPLVCVNYATCQTESMCVAACPTDPPEVCNGVDDDCDGGVDEGFQCLAGQTQTEACGSCGTRTRTCTGGCSWGAWSACSGGGVCTPGQTESASCGDCGTKTRTCTASCTWGSYGSCTGQGVCSAGQTQSQACGNCGSQTRTCSSSCTWGSYGSCTGQGVCSPGQTQSQACGNCGTQSRSCSSSCTWGSYGSCTGQGVCSPGATTQSGCDVCAQKTCSSSCQWSSCGILPGKNCLWESGTNWECCGVHKWHFCLPPSYGAAGCKWSTDCVYVGNACY